MHKLHLLCDKRNAWKDNNSEKKQRGVGLSKWCWHPQMLGFKSHVWFILYIVGKRKQKKTALTISTKSTKDAAETSLTPALRESLQPSSKSPSQVNRTLKSYSHPSVYPSSFILLITLLPCWLVPLLCLSDPRVPFPIRNTVIYCLLTNEENNLLKGVYCFCTE